MCACACLRRAEPMPLGLLLPGARLGDRILACAGALAGIAGTAALLHLFRIDARGVPLILAPMGASAVLLFAVPASPLAQPWPMIGGNVVSAAIGVAVVRLPLDPALAVGLAVGAAILAMSLLRCLHPPGGAAALTAVIGGPAITATGYAFPFVIMAANSALLLGAAWLFHRVSGHSYPHRPAPAITPALLHRDDIERALAEQDEAFDIDPGDLERLLQRAEAHAVERRKARR